jgi:lysophospholipase L1-like esterase
MFHPSAFRLVSVLSLMLFLPLHGFAQASDSGTANASGTKRPLVVCLGDSITRRGYPEELAKLLPVRVVNAGINGNTSRQGLARLQRDALSLNPDVVVLFFGANDSRLDAPKTQVAIEEFTTNLSTIVERCQGAHAKVLLGTLPPITPGPYFGRHPKQNYDAIGGFEKHIESYRQAALKIGREIGVPVVDLNHLLREQPSWVSEDGVHPTTPGGNEIIAKTIAKELKPLLPKSDR